jgi:hypothetical protein
MTNCFEGLRRAKALVTAVQALPSGRLRYRKLSVPLAARAVTQETTARYRGGAPGVGFPGSHKFA